MQPLIISGSRLSEVLKRVQEWEKKGYECSHKIVKVDQFFKNYKRDMTTYSKKYFKKRKFVGSENETKYMVKMRLKESEINNVGSIN